MMLYRMQLHIAPSGLEQNGCAADRKLTDAALTQPATDDDALRLFPVLEAQEATDDRRKLLRKLFDGAVDDPGRFRIALYENLVELLLAQLFAWRVTKRIVADARDALAPVVEDRLECALARAVA